MRELLLLLSAVAAGVVNSIAGGGTLLTFPSLLAAGMAPLTANATSSVSLVPGSLSAFLGYRRDIGGDWRVVWALAIPSLVGGALGAQLALWSSDKLFSQVVPWLILGATVLFAAQERLRGRLRRQQDHDHDTSVPAHTARQLAVLAAVQLLVAIYGGYFGAAMGILMLAALGLVGETNLHRMNGLKNLAAVCINSTGTLTFILGGRVDWPYALLMAAGAILGGYAGAGVAKRVGQATVRRLIVAIGLALGAYMLWHQLSP